MAMKLRLPLYLVATLIVLLLPSMTAAEVPGVWFLNARLTGSDYVYLAVGGNDQQPPAAADEVKLSWRWVESNTDIPSYPDPDVEVVYRQSGSTGKRAQAWSVDAELTGFPVLAVGPGRELWLVADVDDAEGLAEASRWSVLLDAVEAAWRQSAPQLNQAERLGDLDIGRLGGCVVRSRPVPANLSLTEDAGWRPMTLTSHARPSRRGGYTYVQPNEPPRPDELRDVEVRRFQRWLERRNPDDCQGEAGYLILRLFPVPQDDVARLRSDHFLDVHWVDTQAVAMTDLAADPWRPGVRALAPLAPSTWNAAPTFLQPPTSFSPSGIDLCTLAGSAELCARDREVRSRLYTWAPEAPSPGLDDLQGSLLEACSERLGGATPCNDVDLWQRNLGRSLLTGFGGDLVLSEEPPILSRVGDDGTVSWLWQADPDAAAPTTEALFQLPDGAAVTLRLPDLDPQRDEPVATNDPGSVPAPIETPTTAGREWGLEGLGFSVEGDTLHLPGNLKVPLTWALSAVGAILLLLVVLFVLRGMRRRTNLDTTTMSRLRPDFEDPFPELTPAPQLSGTLPMLPAPTEPTELPEPPTPQLAVVADDAESPGPPTLPRFSVDLGPEQGIEDAFADSTSDETLDVTIADLPSARAAGRSAQESALRERLRQLERQHQQDQQRIDAMADQLQALEARLLHVAAVPPVAAVAEAAPPADEPSGDGPATALVLRRGLGRWIEHLWPILTEVALRAVPASDLESLLGVLPAPAQHEFRGSRATLRRFTEATGDPESLPLNTLCEVVAALQYLTEAFPREQLDPSTYKSLRQALSESMPGHGLPASFHELIIDLAAELDLEYQPAPYYNARLGHERYPFLESHCKALDLAARAGSALRTEAGTVVRLEPPFFSRDGERVCGVAWVFE